MSEQKKRIAIVGMACRFPGEATSPEAYWEVLKNGKDVITEVSSGRWGTNFYKHPDKKEPGKSYTFSAGVLNQVDEFDAAFFGISPREAAQMDPQQRLLLELTWEALEDGQQIPESLAGSKCAVYIGIASTDYAHRRMDDLSSLDPYSMTGNTASIASNRISYVFDLQGPSVSVDTACSSSLVALHQACNAIWNGDAPMAITGGVNMLLHPFGFVGFSKASMLSPRGRCRAFDASGDGYVRSEGSAVLFLKPLEDAEAAGDPIHAVIIDTGINCDGRTNGITLPSSDGQANLLHNLYERSGIAPDDLSYIEAHGTGTAVGDPLEAAALAKVLAKSRKKPLPIGSAKTNVGHLETASGMAGLLKVVLSLKNKTLPPSLHFNEPNPNIDFKKDQLSVVTKLTSLNNSKKPLLMGVNSFGFGGANAHVIVQEYLPKKNKRKKSTKNKNITENSVNDFVYSPLFLSAQNTNALKEMAGQYRDLLQRDEANYQDIAWSAYSSKQKFTQGLAVHGEKLSEIIECLHAFSQGEIHTGTTTATKIETNCESTKTNKLALVFSGNGSQWQGMGRELLKQEPIFLQAVNEVEQLFKKYSDISLIDEFNASEDDSKLALTEVAQPLLFALQVGLIRVLVANGMKFDAVVGHSVGEVAAAWASGILNLEQAVKVIYYRSNAQAKTQGAGKMAAASMSSDSAEKLINKLGLEGRVSIAGINSPQSVTLSGSLENLNLISEIFERQGRFYRILDLDYAFHSPSMDPVKQEIIDCLDGLERKVSEKEYFSTVTGNLLSGKNLDSNYWWENIRKPVEFSKAVNEMMDDGYQVFLEIGPHPVLKTYINECGKEKEFANVIHSTIKRNTESKNIVLNGLYNCFLAGCELDEEKLFLGNEKHIQLPHYPWQREKHWYTLTAEGYDLVNRDRKHPLLGYPIKNHDFIWENHIDISLQNYLGDHVVDGGAVMPAAAYVEMALAASKFTFGSSENSSSWEIQNIEIKSPIVLDHAKTTRLEINENDGSFVVRSKDRLSESSWALNVVGRLIGKTNKKVPQNFNISNFKKSAKSIVTSPGHYRLTESVGLDYGTNFQGIEKVWVSGSKALSKISLNAELQTSNSEYLIHPTMLDAGFQMLVDIFSDDITNGNQAALIPVQIGGLYFYKEMSDLAYISAEVKKQSPQSVVADYHLLDSEGTILAELVNCRFRGVHFSKSKTSLPPTYVFKPVLMPFVEAGEESSVPEPASLVTHVIEHLKDHKDIHQRDAHFQKVLPLFDLMVSMFIWQALHELNPKGDEFTVESLAEQAHIESTKFPLVYRFLEILVEDELATYNNGRWLLASSSDLPDAESIWLSVLGDSPSYLPELMLLGRCGKHLTDVLQNQIDPDKLLFSDKSSIQEHWAGASPSNLSMNLALKDVLEEIVSNWPVNKRVRILEIGGRNTEISQLILPVLPQNQTDYLYTNKDEGLVSKASFELEGWLFVETKSIDLNQDLDSENLDLILASYDIIIAANTLYCSDDYPKVQENIKKLLAPKGVLLMLERQSDRFMDMTFGLQTDWWAHTVENANPIPLLMTASSWRNELKEFGFDKVELLIEPEATGDVGAFMVLANHQEMQEYSYIKESDPKFQKYWLILKDNNEVSSEITELLKIELHKLGYQIVLVEPGKTYKRLGSMHFSICFDDDAENEERLNHVFETLSKNNIYCENIIHLMGLEWHSNANDSYISDSKIEKLRCASSIDLIQGLETLSQEKSPNLYLVTSGGATSNYQGESFEFDACPSQAALWGLGRVIMNEHPDLNCKLLDLQGVLDYQSIVKRLSNEILFHKNNKFENEVILGQDVRHVLRMVRQDVTYNQSTDVPSPNKVDFVLDFSAPGQLKNLYWKQLPQRFLQSDEIEIKPNATGLNFRDVMYSMGLLSDEAVENGFAGPTLGMELSGTVINTGSAVSEFSVGDEVVGFAPACFSSRVITQTTAITHKPQSWSFEEAATIPTTFFTVYYALKHLAQIQEGEKILIHGAAGGVGIAAIQFARFCGAEIFATAGSDEKRDFVRLLGADHVMDSRSLAFSDEIMEITKGEGIDIVLNSLAGEAITRNLSVLKPFGRFLELGKRDFYENSKIGLRPFRNNISYFGIDADQLLIERPQLANKLFKEMMALFDDGSLRPMPYRSFPASRIQDAFRYMQQSRQIGKVVVSFENGNTISDNEISSNQEEQAEFKCDPEASYLVTGGLSGFGLKTATWLVEKGATSLVLISRSASISDKDQYMLDRFIEQGVEVYKQACDVTDKKSVAKLFAELNSGTKPLKGIIHAAMVLDDALIRNMTNEQLEKVMKPKITGSWNLHEQSKSLDLDFFVFYSSATTFVGNPGQANYVAANSYMESLASLRNSQGLPGCYVAWGAIDDVGYLARNENTKAALQSRLGGHALNSDKALRVLEKIITSNIVGAAVIDLDWSTIKKVMPAANSPKYEELQRHIKNSDSDQYEDIQTLISNLSKTEIQELVTDLLLDEIEQILRLPREKLDIEQSIFDLGMDSLMGMELVLAIEERFGVKLPVMALTEGSNIQRIAERITLQLSDTDDETSTVEAKNSQEQHENISVAASRHGHTEKMTEQEAAELSRKLIEDAMKH